MSASHPSRVETPNLDKYVEHAREEGSILTAFLDWLDEEGIALCRPDGGHYWPITENRDDLLTRHVGLDPEAVRRERQAVYEAVAAQAARRRDE